MVDPAAMQNKLPSHLLATHAMLCTLYVVERLGETIEEAKSIGNARDSNHHAECWFDAGDLTLTVQFRTEASAEASKVLACLLENGYHGFVGPFEVDDVKIKDGYVVVYLRQGSDREPLDNPEKLVVATVRLIP